MKLGKKKFQYVNCYYCGRMVRLDKAMVLYLTPRVVPEVKESDKPFAVFTAPKKIYICPACVRFRGLDKKTVKKEELLLKKLGIEI